MSTADYITLGTYLALLFLLGVIFSRFNKNLSDFVRGGSQATWWMVGASNTIAVVSAFTFTGAASIAFLVGPTVFATNLANITGFFLCFLFLGAWFRQTRAYTTADLVRTRFGVAAEQVGVYFQLVSAPFAASIQLWALASFSSAIFQMPLIPTIAVIGVVVTFYSTTGGRWAVLATDFVQNLLIFTITIVIGVLALIEIGGLQAFLGYFDDPKFAADFKFVNRSDEFANGEFGPLWVVMAFLMTIWHQLGLVSAHRYFAVKTGRDARKASLFSFFLSILGMCVWFIPPMVARFLYEAEVNALDVAKPAEASYAFMAERLLPNGMMGLFVAAMFAATMSSMDTGLNATTGNIVRNLIPRLLSKLKKPAMSSASELLMCKLVTVFLGMLIIIYSVSFALNRELELFQAFFVITSLIGLPMVFPMVAGLYVKKLANWAWFVIVGSCFVPSVYTIIDNNFFGGNWIYYERALMVIVAGFISTFVCTLFYDKYSNPAFKVQLDEFFKQMHTPVDFEKEIGKSQDYQQLFLIGNITTLVGVAMLLLLLAPNEAWGRVCLVSVSLVFCALGILMRFGARREKLKESALLEKSRRKIENPV